MRNAALGVALGAVLISSASATVIIDDFSTGAQSAGSISDGVFVGSTVVASVPGGFRSAQIACENTGGGPLTTCSAGRTARFDIGFGFATIAASNGVDSDFRLLYDGNGAGLGGYDIAPGGEQYFNVIIVSSDAEAIGTAVTLTLVDTAGSGSTTFSQTLNFGFQPPPNLVLSFLLQDFIDAGVEVNALHSIGLRFNGVTANPGHDYDISLLVTGAVPEPGTYALIGAGLIGLAALRRRK